MQGGVIEGWLEGLKGQKVGSEVLLVVPPSLGYGDQAQGEIPANSTLVFVVDHSREVLIGNLAYRIDMEALRGPQATERFHIRADTGHLEQAQCAVIGALHVVVIEQRQSKPRSLRAPAPAG